MSSAPKISQRLHHCAPVKLTKITNPSPRSHLYVVTPDRRSIPTVYTNAGAHDKRCKLRRLWGSTEVALHHLLCPRPNHQSLAAPLLSRIHQHSAIPKLGLREVQDEMSKSGRKLSLPSTPTGKAGYATGLAFNCSGSG